MNVNHLTAQSNPSKAVTGICTWLKCFAKSRAQAYRLTGTLTVARLDASQNIRLQCNAMLEGGTMRGVMRMIVNVKGDILLLLPPAGSRFHVMRTKALELIENAEREVSCG